MLFSVTGGRTLTAILLLACRRLCAGGVSEKLVDVLLVLYRQGAAQGGKNLNAACRLQGDVWKSRGEECWRVLPCEDV